MAKSGKRVRLDRYGHNTLPDGLWHPTMEPSEGAEAARIRFRLGQQGSMDVPLSASALRDLKNLLLRFDDAKIDAMLANETAFSPIPPDRLK